MTIDTHGRWPSAAAAMHTAMALRERIAFSAGLPLAVKLRMRSGH